MKNKLFTVLLILIIVTAMLAGCRKESDDAEAEDTEVAETKENIEADVTVEVQEMLLVLDANGGMMTFGTDVPYEADVYLYYLHEGKSLQENMESDGNDPVVDISKEGETFAGWTIYEGDFAGWPEEEPDSLADGSMYFSAGGYMNIMLDNCEVYSESVSTEELKEILCEDRTYYAVANWK